MLNHKYIALQLHALTLILPLVPGADPELIRRILFVEELIQFRIL